MLLLVEWKELLQLSLGKCSCCCCGRRRERNAIAATASGKEEVKLSITGGESNNVVCHRKRRKGLPSLKKSSRCYCYR
ncbi:hypothetical protein OIU84_007072 [Salix udensis]|uniref:Secreted protein n=1 Tax=Salix udensis TaxID=889485 RepID=A0AAD6JTY0_9ROSI|nr:hypothetical protein OIU84_007072 [Salix udensis]